MASATFAYINIGQFPNDQTGDTLRTAFQKVNQNNANLSYAVGILGNVAYANILANANVIAVPNSLVIRDSTASGFFANLTASGAIAANTLSITGHYELPFGNGTAGQAILAYGNGVTYWGSIGGGTAPGASTDILYNQSGAISAAAAVQTDGNNFIVGGNLSVTGGIVCGPPHIMTANANPVIDLSLGTMQIINLTANVGSGNATVINAIDGRTYNFIIRQSSGGGLTWIWPNGFLGGGNISASNFNANPNTYGSQQFSYANSYSTFYALGALITNS